MKNKLLLSSLLVIATTVIPLVTQAQYYSLAKLYAPGNPGGINTDLDFNNSSASPPNGAKSIYSYGSAKAYMLQYSTAQTIPFAFNFNGGSVSSFKICSSGYITFSKIAALPVGPANAALPAAALPDSTVCAWGLAGAGLGGEIYTKLYGTAPHRQLWIDWWFAGNPSDTNSQNLWAIVLEETTNNIYVVDQYGKGNTISKSGIYKPINLTIGVQVNSTTAYQIGGSPNIQSLTTNPLNSDNDYYEFAPGVQPNYSAGVVKTNINSALYYGLGVPNNIVAKVANFGFDTIKSFDFKWSISSGVPNRDSVSGVSIASAPIVGYDSVIHTINWTPSVVGTYTLKLWVDTLNGTNANQTPFLDTLIISNIRVVDTVVPKMVILEDFMQASCDPCLQATPNLDSVLTNNKSTCIPIRYHCDIPGTDYINNEIDTVFVAKRMSYYGVTAIPDTKLDGSLDEDPAVISSAQIQNEVAMGSPFKINITACTVNYGFQTSPVYSLTADITDYGNSNAGLIAQAVLTVDTIKYFKDQSSEDPVSYFGLAGSYPSSWLQYVLNFPQVAEEMFPSSKGTSLAAFTPGQTQTINISWTKNRPWGFNPKIDTYDSTGVHITVFVQDNSTKYIYQAATIVPTSIVGIDQLSNNSESMTVFPNPTNAEAYVEYNISKTENVTIQLYDMLGQKISEVYNGQQSAGKHEVLIRRGNLQAGMYFVSLTTENGVVVQKLQIQP